MLLHANHAGKAEYENIVIINDDTDVMIIGLGHIKSHSGNLFQKLGNQNRCKLINLTQILNVLRSNIFEALIGLHSFTGCDSVSAFAGKGKTSALKLVKKEEKFQDLFLRTGQDLTVTQDDMALFEEFVFCLYGGQKLKVKDVSELRYLLFCAKGAEVDINYLQAEVVFRSISFEQIINPLFGKIASKI